MSEVVIDLRFGDCLELIKDVPDGSVDCVFIDPPYIGMVNQSWDRLTESEACLFFDSLLRQSYRCLRYGGRFLSFASNDTLQFLYSRYFQHRELLVVDKDVKKVSAGRNTRKYKQHVNCSEYIFVATKYAREYTRELLVSSSEGMTAKEINTLLGCASNGGGMWSIYTGENVCHQVPTEKQWNKFRDIFPRLPEYSFFEEVFHNGLGKGNVLKGFSFEIKDRQHPTQKPLKLVEYIVSTYTRDGDVVLDACMGVGTTGEACLSTKRNFIGMENDPKYFEIARRRLTRQNVCAKIEDV
jgi:adenine-specific DNA-methyltransferase